MKFTTSATAALSLMVVASANAFVAQPLTASTSVAFTSTVPSVVGRSSTTSALNMVATNEIVTTSSEATKPRKTREVCLGFVFSPAYSDSLLHVCLSMCFVVF